MPSGTFKITDIPEDKVQMVVALYNAEDPPPESVEKIDQGGGLWTVVATFTGDGHVEQPYQG
jgi:hypothetical protein